MQAQAPLKTWEMPKAMKGAFSFVKSLLEREKLSSRREEIKSVITSRATDKLIWKRKLMLLFYKCHLLVISIFKYAITVKWSKFLNN